MSESWILAVLLATGPVFNSPEFPTFEQCQEAGREIEEAHVESEVPSPRWICIYKGDRSPVIPLRPL